MDKKNTNTKNSKHNGADHDCNSLSRKECYCCGCPEAGTPCCKLFGRLPDFFFAA